MSERVRLLLHEAIDIDRLVREYAQRPRLQHDEIVDLIDDYEGDTDRKVAAILSPAESDDRDEAVRVPAVEDLLNRLGEMYETALARREVHRK